MCRIVTRAWNLIEETHPDTKPWDLGGTELTTKKHFHEKNGFKKIREVPVEDIHWATAKSWIPNACESKTVL